MKKKTKTTLLLAALSAAALTGCNVSKSETTTYDVLGEKIEVKLDTSNNLSLSAQDGQFEVKDNSGNVISTGCFTDGATYEYYYNIVTGSQDYKEGSVNGNDYLYYEFDGYSGPEYNYLIDISNSDVYVIMRNVESESSAKDVANSLSFSSKN